MLAQTKIWRTATHGAAQGNTPFLGLQTRVVRQGKSLQPLLFRVLILLSTEIVVPGSTFVWNSCVSGVLVAVGRANRQLTPVDDVVCLW